MYELNTGSHQLSEFYARDGTPLHRPTPGVEVLLLGTFIFPLVRLELTAAWRGRRARFLLLV
jgi:hypothetical protein